MDKVKNLLDLNTEERKNFLDSFDILMTDCDGVIWNYKEYIPNAGKALNDVESLGKTVVYVSNNSIRSDEGYEKKIRELGATFKQENLVHPIHSILHYLKKNNCQSMIYYIGALHNRDLLLAEGFNVIDGPHGRIPDEFNNFFDALKTNLPVKFVIIDLCFTLNYIEMCRSIKYLRDPECQLIIGCNDEDVFLSNEHKFKGSAYFINTVKSTMSPEKKPILLGKPGDDLGDILKDRYGVKDPQRVLFVGDFLYADVKFAKNAGFQSLLVLTGCISREEMLNVNDNSVIPNFYANSIADLATLIDSIHLEKAECTKL